ncbi:hypothetical protein CspeluHIS016_0206600 [Cutaneotrichosporon spelunceum]|uniref:ATP-binding cassette transporter n=1 Tax=Cutaneotrichosporon spelunceum TaxID=1672016 RepID=A0AAD3TRS9_9TREE|nr:hypothetical protein CspeluHIS016_0206600 [Cutaneotrichosporon spelunceum]
MAFAQPRGIVQAAKVAFLSGGKDLAVTTMFKEPKPHPRPFIVRHTLFVLPLFALISAVTLLLSYGIPWLYKRYRRRRQGVFLDGDEGDEVEIEAPPPLMPTQGLWPDFRAHLRRLATEGLFIACLDFVRMICLCALVGLSILAVVQAEPPSKGPKNQSYAEIMKKKKKGKKRKDKPILDEYSTLEWAESGVSFFYFYNLIFCFFILTLRPTKLRRKLTKHVDLLLVLAFAVYAYRDIWPSLTYYLSPSDVNNWVTWTRIAILSFAGVVIPLIRPRTYVPVDPLNPTPPEKIHPEQTAPPIIFLFYEFMTNLVIKAWGTSSLPYEDLHPLADYDRAEYLYGQHMKTLDPVRRREQELPQRHLFFTLSYAFRWTLFWSCVMCAIAAIAEILPVYAINNVLKYLETDGVGARIRPIVWVSLLFLAPLLSSLAIQYYIFMMTRFLVRSEAILTQLLFDQALRLRMKDSVGSEEEKIDGEAQTISVDTPNDSQILDPTVQAAPNNSAARADSEPVAEAKASPSQGIVGRINVLMAQDVEAVVEGRDIPLALVYIPLQVALCLYLLYQVLSYSALFGVAAMVLTLPLPGWFTALATRVQTDKMSATDARVDAITEAVGALRMIKMFGWEEKIKARIAAKREVELKLTWKRRMLNLLLEMVNIILPVMVMVAALAGYTLVQKRHLTSSVVYTSMALFELLKGQMMMGFFMISEWITAGVSLQRLNKFMNESEMIDAYSQGNHVVVNTPEKVEAEREGLIRVKDAVFAWGTDSPDKTVVNFRLRIPDVTFSKGKINLVCGPTGSGKSSLLAALIGELHFEPQNDTAFYHLPREGGVSYAAQESWCTSASIQENILFGRPYDHARYRKVLHDCALEQDLKLFDDGDETEIGEKGITLSGGQKARVTLARAIYSATEIVLLDDIFAALDTLTSRFILDNLFKGDLVKDRTVVLVTHHTHLAGPIADYMVTLDANGTVAHAGPIDASMISAGPSQVDLTSVGQPSENDEDTTVAPTPVDHEDAEEQNGNGATKKPSKLIKDEEKSEGRISRRALKSFFSTFGGPTFWIIYFALLFGGQVMSSFQTWWLGRWSKAYENVSEPSMVSVPYWLGLYVVWVVLGVLGFAISAILYYVGAMKASREIHQKLVDSIFGTYMRFLDTTPVGRIISRFTKDMRSIDGPFTELAIGVFDITMGLVIKLVTIVAVVPFFSIPAIIIGVLGGIIGEMYIHAQLSVKREMSNAKSPLFSHLASSVSGIVSIRAYGAQEQIKNQTREKADKYTRTATAFYNLNRWVTVRIDMLGGLFSMTLAYFLVYVVRLNPNTSGFALTQAITFAGTILWWVRMLNEMEVQGNSVERIEDYLVIAQEPKYEKNRATAAAWPTSGEIALEGLSAKYSEDGPTVLDNLTVNIKSGEKVGIVGRTGSGKSTLALALLRMLPTSGKVYIDGVDTDNINLHDLRTNVTIIPQDPILLSGTLRFNLDPFGEREDAELNEALDRSGLRMTSGAESGGATPTRITLDTQIAAGGSNLSQGQRQLVALARALVRRSKVLILDEATASVDFATDAIIQKSIRDLPSDTTVLTVAHRLATVMDYDKILVLGGGKVLEFDSPDALTEDKDSYFAKLVQAMES